MKETIKINISGVVFNIDEDAYEILHAYLNRITTHFSKQVEGKEIINDIENRIAEIFRSKLSETKEVISVDDVKEMIAILGQPEDIINGDEEFQEENTSYTRETKKKLYRDMDNSAIAGVCAGLSAYFNIDIVWMRIIFILLFFVHGLGFLLYIIIWIVAPKAVTAAQKLEMKGEKVTVSNIEKSVKEEYQQVKSNFKKMRNSDTYHNVENGARDVIHTLGNIFMVFIKVILAIIGIGFIIGGVSALIALLGVLFLGSSATFFGDTFFDYYSLNDFVAQFVDPSNVTLFIIGMMLTTLIPLVGLIYLGLKMIFRFRANDKYLGLTAFVGWIIGVMMLASLSMYSAKDFSREGRSTESWYLHNQTSDTLFVDINQNHDIDFRDDNVVIDIDGYEIVKGRFNNMLYGKPRIELERSYDEDFEIIVRKKSKGFTKSDAIDNASNIDFNWEHNNNVLLIDPAFTLVQNTKWRFPRASIIIKIPVGKTIYFDEDTEEFLYDISNQHWDGEIPGEFWTMTEHGIEHTEKYYHEVQ